MGFFKKSTKGEGIVEDIDGSSANENENISPEEEVYMKMYMKIARDFVHKDDLYRILNELISLLDLEEEVSFEESTSSAEQRAEEYKHFLETDQSGSDHYPDIIDLNKE